MTPSSKLSPESDPSSNLSDEVSPEISTRETAKSTLVQELASAQPTQARKFNRNAWATFASTFVTIFLAEMGDKTQLATLLMTAESHKPWVVFAGAGSALVLTSLLGVLVGQWLARRISPQTLERAAGITLLVISGLLFWEVFQ